MTGLTSLFDSKKSSVAILAILVVTFADPSVAEWLPNLSDMHVMWIGIIVCTLIVAQAAVDVAQVVWGRTDEPIETPPATK